jgi:hypothetical protein
MIDERDPSTFYTLSRKIAHNIHYSKVDTIGREVQWVEFCTWSKCDAMLATTNILSFTASKEIHKR